jgi:hypothetical protein
MKGLGWQWISATSIGTSHIRAKRGCDDAGACVVVQGQNESALIVVCSDGAGSAPLSSVGSRIVVRAFCRSAIRYLQRGGAVGDISREVVGDWLDDIRGRIEAVSRSKDLRPRDFAATLIGCVITDCGAKVLHVGDGAVVYRTVECEEWLIGSWPSHGEYASTTHFVTDDPEPTFQFNDLAGQVSEIAVFSDGIEHLVLDFSNRSAFSPFFSQMFSSFKSDVVGRDRSLSRHLMNYLSGASVCDRTDDDKTLIMARRISDVTPKEHF